jgi:hypothetical protein
VCGLVNESVAEAALAKTQRTVNLVKSIMEEDVVGLRGDGVLREQLAR